jgi:DNA-binding MarR family transcriptional regulator
VARRSSASALEAHAGYWLRKVSNHVSQAFRLKMEAHGVTVAEWVVMRQLLDGGETHPSHLAESLGMTRGAISKLVERLSVKGMVARRAAMGDRRYQTIGLSAAGRKLVPVLAGLADKNDAEFFGHLSGAELSALTGTLRGIVRRRQLKGVPVD